MNLDELQRLAEGSTPGKWEHDSDCESLYSETGYRIADFPCIAPHNRKRQDANAAYIAAMSPDTAKKLIAVAKREEVLRAAAQAVLDRWNSPRWEWHKQGPTADLMAALRTALEELK